MEKEIKRNSGIDFLRLLLMFMITILHVVGVGGLLTKTKDDNLFYFTSWSFETLSFCAVDCFAMITGFFLYNSKFKLSRILNLWFQVLFYSVCISSIFFYFYPESINTENILNAIFPVTRRQYWYISSYFGLCLFIPFLNAGIEKISKEYFKKLLILFFIFISIFPTFLLKDPLLFGKGYGTLWLIVMYLLGAYIAKFDALKNLSKTTSLFLFFLFNFLALLLKFLIEKKEVLLFYEERSDFLIDYISPFIVLSAICLFSFCLKLKFNNFFCKVLSFLSPSALAVYLIHTQPLILYKFVKNFAMEEQNVFGYSLLIYPENSIFIFIWKIILLTFVVFSLSIIIDLVRRLLFKIFKINSLSKKIESLF